MSDHSVPRVDERAGAADLLAHWSGDFPFLLDSGGYGGPTGRYSLLLGECGERIECYPGDDAEAFLAALKPPLGSRSDMALPYAGGWFVYLAYDFATLLESHLAGLPLHPELPLAVAVRCESALIVDHVLDRTVQVGRAEPSGSAPTVDGPLAVGFEPEAESRFVAGAERIDEYIHSGDVYQVNLSRRWHASGPVAASAAFARLRARNAAPFMALADFGSFALASASPERLFKAADGCIQTRPIAGTRPRGATPDDDRRLQAELRDNLKERSEHIMLVDLERNDLGRLCQPGSVDVDELLALESYASVHHIVSNVRGRLRADVSLADIIRAVFPGGTITGCPKIRCMQIIGELEGRGRAAYTGSVGYVSDNGRMDFNILIRTLMTTADAAWLDAGAGIVADSRPWAEVRETEAKAAGLLDALCR